MFGFEQDILRFPSESYGISENSINFEQLYLRAPEELEALAWLFEKL